MKMKQVLTVFLTHLALGAPLVALAAIDDPTKVKPLPTTFGNLEDFFTGIRTIGNWMFAFLLVIGVIVLLVGAFNYLMAGGDAEKQGEARQRIIYGLIGIAVGTLALALVTVVSTYFGGGFK